MRHLTLACLLAFIVACGGGNTTPDAATTPTDAFGGGVDTSPVLGDAFVDRDAPPSTDDAFVSPTDDAFTMTDSGMCVRPTTDLTELGADCSETACPTGLECIEFVGFVLQRYCGIRCEESDGGECACPESLVCETVSDKSGPRQECVDPGV